MREQLKKDLDMTIEELASEIIKWEEKGVRAGNDGNLLVAMLAWRMTGRYDLLLELRKAGAL